MRKLKKALRLVGKAVQIAGVGLGTAAVTDPGSLSGLIPPEHLPTVIGVSAIINAFLPALAGKAAKDTLPRQ